MPASPASAFALVTSHVADMVGLRDRGRLARLRADLLRLRIVAETAAGAPCAGARHQSSLMLGSEGRRRDLHGAGPMILSGLRSGTIAMTGRAARPCVTPPLRLPRALDALIAIAPLRLSRTLHGAFRLAEETGLASLSAACARLRLHRRSAPSRSRCGPSANSLALVPVAAPRRSLPSRLRS